MHAILKLKGKNSMKKMILRCNIDRVDIVTALRSKKALQAVSLESVKRQSTAVALFHLWVCMQILIGSDIVFCALCRVQQLQKRWSRGSL
jgi:hypothetical protein